jgi:deoxyribose-phosphate aldolase
MKLEDYLDSTYLKTPKQSGLSDSQTLEIVHNLVREANLHGFYAVMIRPDYVRSVRMLLDEFHSKVKLGTVIDFPEGRSSVASKLAEAQRAIADGADELDFVIDYSAFKSGNFEKVKEEVEACTRLCMNFEKTTKWIIETAALTDNEIIEISQLIREIILEKLECPPELVFVKSSTGFYETPNGEPNGANEHVIKLMIENAKPLPVKASGGVKSQEDAKKMIKLGVKRIGTSSALKIVNGENSTENY